LEEINDDDGLSELLKGIEELEFEAKQERVTLNQVRSFYSDLIGSRPIVSIPNEVWSAMTESEARAISNFRNTGSQFEHWRVVIRKVTWRIMEVTQSRYLKLMRTLTNLNKQYANRIAQKSKKNNNGHGTEHQKVLAYLNEYVNELKAHRKAEKNIIKGKRYDDTTQG
jgi:hypothetical protein